MAITNGWDKSKRKCEQCNLQYLPTRDWQKTCSYKCGYYKNNAKKKHGKINQGNCLRCNKGLEARRIDAIYCSKTCKSMDHTFKHRSKTRFTSTARRYEIYLRDNKKCYQCDLTLTQNKFELDHLLPISKGGDSTSLNLAVSCLRCNRSRGARIGEKQMLKLDELRNKWL